MSIPPSARPGPSSTAELASPHVVLAVEAPPELRSEMTRVLIDGPGGCS
jgi:hypothetical protein